VLSSIVSHILCTASSCFQTDTLTSPIHSRTLYNREVGKCFIPHLLWIAGQGERFVSNFLNANRPPRHPNLTRRGAKEVDLK
jgi:hypothetical protein